MTRQTKPSPRRIPVRPTACDTLEPRLLFSAAPNFAATPDFAIFDPNANYVTNLYQTLLHRAPDSAGLAYFEGKLIESSLASVVNQIRNSPEALTNEITNLYERFLHRAPESAGLSYWINKTNQLNLSQDSLMFAIGTSSEEFAFDTANTRFITQLYEWDLGRDPSNAEITFWQNRFLVFTPELTISPSSGIPIRPGPQTTRAMVSSQIANSPEAQQYLINTDYQEYLDRAPNSQELAYWQSPAAPADIQLAILTSPEFAAGAATGPFPFTGAPSPWSAAGASNALTTDLLNALAPANPNLVLSGYSAEAALAMAYEGAAGNTAAQMQQVLHLSSDPTVSLTDSFSQLAASLESSSAGDLQIANSLWAQQGFPILSSFTNALQQMASAGLHQVDFINQTEAAREAINAWVSDQTHAMIPELLPQGTLDSNTRLALVNALYLNANWAQPFNPDNTFTAPFAIPSGGVPATANVQMMTQDNNFKYLDTGDFQAVEMPYAGDNLSMLVFLPKANAANPLAPLTALEQQFTPQNLATWTSEMQPTDIRLQIPQFKLSSTLPLNSTLSNLGMTDAFGSGADFSGITGSSGLHISTVLQKAVIEVGEQGTKAAAATGITIRIDAIEANPTPPTLFRADHPFLFAIRDNTTGALLFTGQVANPALTS